MSIIYFVSNNYVNDIIMKRKNEKWIPISETNANVAVYDL